LFTIPAHADAALDNFARDLDHTESAHQPLVSARPRQLIGVLLSMALIEGFAKTDGAPGKDDHAVDAQDQHLGP
jgi:hypothetical protein